METDEEITDARLFELLTAELNRDAFGNSSHTPTDHTFAPTESSTNGSTNAPIPVNTTTAAGQQPAVPAPQSTLPANYDLLRHWKPCIKCRVWRPDLAFCSPAGKIWKTCNGCRTRARANAEKRRLTLQKKQQDAALKDQAVVEQQPTGTTDSPLQQPTSE